MEACVSFPVMRGTVHAMLSVLGSALRDPKLCARAQTPEQVADAIWRAVSQRKDEITVGAPFQLIGAAYKTFNINPFSAAA